MRNVALGTLALSLAASTGCTFVGGALMGQGLWGEEPVFIGAEPGMAGTSAVCLGTDAPDVEIADDYLLRGRVLTRDAYDSAPEQGFDNVVPCENPVERSLQLEDENGNVWTIGYAWIDQDWDATPAIWVDRGEQVEILVRAPMDNTAAGLVVYDRHDSAIYALESGIGGRALEDGDIGSLRVSEDGVVGESSGDCGDTEHLSVEFESDSDRLVMYPQEDRGMEVDGDYLTVCSIESFRYVDGDCDEDSAEVSWVVFK
ncbi:MAG: hypothetical protein GY913_29325 [Proteobacteria bacterium]|nr:hypothetical protein [Pseudomonadota bacterium]MCP4921017.1 hypothetical protein [Pseudomonadota bacterium]